jgi:hypothetical protein
VWASFETSGKTLANARALVSGFNTEADVNLDDHDEELKALWLELDRALALRKKTR